MGRLTQEFVDRVKEPGRYGDGRGSRGLALRVKRRADGSIAKTWEQQLRMSFVACGILSVGLGSVDELKLRAAQDKAFYNAKALAAGEEIRPSLVRAAAASESAASRTFEQVMEHLFTEKRKEWQGERTEKQFRARVTQYAKPLLGMRVDAITAPQILAALDKAGTLTATRNKVLGYVKQVLDHAHRMGWCTANAAAPLRPLKHTAEHRKSVAASEITEVLSRVDEAASWPLTSLAARFVALTCLRDGEVLGATWDEIDIEARTWEIPAERMKQRRPHRVPLSSAALDVLKQAATLGDGGDLVFHSPTGRRLPTVRLAEVFRKAEVGCVPHGLRSSFGDWAAEAGILRDVAESVLAHQEGNAVRRAYVRTDFYMQRIPVMEQWAHIIAGDAPLAEVVPFPAAAANA